MDKKAILKITEAYCAEESLLADPIRKGERVEIPAANALALMRFDGDAEKAKELLDLVVSMQDSVGYWTEFPYGETDAILGYAGAVPTSFAVIALAEGHVLFKDERYLEAARRGAHYLYLSEQNGYFLKAALNKADVINTNLLAGYALLVLRDLFPDGATERDRYRFAAARAMRRAMASQFLNGAYPYISYGFTVPFLYHAMSAALLGLYQRHFNDAVLRISFHKAIKYLRTIMDEDTGKFLWERANNKDKEGAVWAYAWSKVAFELACADRDAAKMDERLHALKGEKWLKGGDFDPREDLFFTAWSLFALALYKKPETDFRPGDTERLTLLLLMLTSLPQRILYLIKILGRRSGVFPDRGPAEEY